MRSFRSKGRGNGGKLSKFESLRKCGAIDVYHLFYKIGEAIKYPLEAVGDVRPPPLPPSIFFSFMQFLAKIW